MTFIKKNLIILPAMAPNEQLREFVHSGNDILALTPAAMLSAEIAGYPSKVVEDFYRIDDFRKDLLNLNRKTEIVFRELDKGFKSVTGYDRAFSSNIYWFICLFADLLFIEKLKSQIGQRYENVSLITGENPSKVDWKHLKYEELKLLPQSRGLTNKIDILNAVLEPKLILIKQEGPSIEPFWVNKAASFLVRLKPRIQNRLKIFISGFKKETDDRKQNTIFIAQDGYEVRKVKEHLSQLPIVYPMKIVEKRVQDLQPEEYTFLNVEEEWNQFVHENFKASHQFMSGLFSAYIREVVGRIRPARGLFENLFSEFKPVMVLFATCAHHPFEGLLAGMANEKNIPVVYFQHGGATIFVNHIYQKYLERNPAIKKTLILNSTKELMEATHEGVECRAFGSKRLYEFSKHIDFKKKHRNRVMYCCGPFPYATYKELFASVSDSECYRVNRDIIEAAKDCHLPLDIKVHPVEQDLSYHYFKRILREMNCPNARVIYGVPVESILEKYGLLVLEYLPTAVLPYALVIDRPVVLYLRDVSLMNPFVRDDLQERCYIVSDREELDDVFKRFADRDLPSKWSSRIVDEYAYSQSGSAPGPVIASFLKGLMEPGNASNCSEDIPGA